MSATWISEAGEWPALPRDMLYKLFLEPLNAGM